MTKEEARLEESRAQRGNWKRWGPYLSDRAWGTVREDYSPAGTAWEYFPHDHARSRAYRWSEDGLAGICDRAQSLCFAIALWNGRDPILKERLFGLTGNEGRHGEDVKEYYFHLDSTPTHSYLKFLYKYPQSAFPYTDLLQGNARRGRNDPEYELLDTGVFDKDRYFDVFVEYAKAAPEDILVRISLVNRGREAATVDVLPTIWFRNTWSWGLDARKPRLQLEDARTVRARHFELGDRWLRCEGDPEFLFTENETNFHRLYGIENPSRRVKDGINDYIVAGAKEAVNAEKFGTKASARYRLTIAAGETETLRLRLTAAKPGDETSGAAFEETFAARIR
jgi:hypothetical protein